MIKEEVDLVFPLFDGAAETGKITRKAFTEWVVSLLSFQEYYFCDFTNESLCFVEFNDLCCGSF